MPHVKDCYSGIKWLTLSNYWRKSIKTYQNLEKFLFPLHLKVDTIELSDKKWYILIDFTCEWNWVMR